MSDAADNETEMHILAGIAGILSEYKPAGVDSSNTGVDSSNAGVDSSDAGVDSSDAGVDSSDAGVDSSNASVDSSDAGVDSSNIENREKSRVQQPNNDKVKVLVINGKDWNTPLMLI